MDLLASSGMKQGQADARYVKGQQAARTRGGLSLIAGNVNNLATGLVTVSTAGTYATFRSRHQNLTGKRVVSLIVVYGNYNIQNSTEASQNSTSGFVITVKSAFERMGSAVGTEDGQRIKLDRNRPVTIPNGMLYFTQEHNITIEANEVFFIRTGVTVGTNNDRYPRGLCVRGGTTSGSYGVNNGEGSTTSTDRVDPGAGNTAIGAANAVYTPVAILGRLEDGSIADSVALMGDSIMAGYSDGAAGRDRGGWGLGVFANYPMVYLPVSGEKMADWAVESGSVCRRQLRDFATLVVNAYGRNDLSGSTLSAFQTNVIADAQRCIARGQKYAMATILPAPTSANGWTSYGGQTPGGADATRKTFNDWIRDTLPTAVPGVQIIDAAAQIERNSSGVKTRDGGYVLPGTQVTSFTATGGSTSTITTTGLTADSLAGMMIEVTSGTNAGLTEAIVGNTATTINLKQTQTVAYDSTSVCRILTTGFNGVHPGTVLVNEIVAGLNAANYF